MLLVISGIFALLLVVIIIVVVVKKEKYVDEYVVYGNGHQYKKLGPYGGCQSCTSQPTPDMMQLPEVSEYGCGKEFIYLPRYNSETESP